MPVVERRTEREAGAALRDLENDAFQLEKRGLVTEDDIGLGDLTDIPGVGEGTARKLKRSGVRQPRDLIGLSQDEIAAVDGIGPKRAAKIRATVSQTAPNVTSYGTNPETERSKSNILRRSHSIDIYDVETIIPNEERGSVDPHPLTVDVVGDDKDDAIAAHADRSEASREADEAFNAPIALTYERWAQNKNRYDYPGVDTVPKGRKRERAEAFLAAALERDAVGRVDVSADPDQLEPRSLGSFKKFSKSLAVRTTGREAEETLAHEVGHAVDQDLGRPSEELFEDDDIRAEVRSLIEKREGGPLTDESHALSGANEMWASLFAAAVTEPRATKRDAPRAFWRLEREVAGDFGRF